MNNFDGKTINELFIESLKYKTIYDQKNSDAALIKAVNLIIGEDELTSQNEDDVNVAKIMLKTIAASIWNLLDDFDPVEAMKYFKDE